MKNYLAAPTAALFVLIIFQAANAQQYIASNHAPIGVMGGHTHQMGNHADQMGDHAHQMGAHAHQTSEWMVSYRYMRMGMEGNRVGTSGISSDAIVTNIANRFFEMPMQPPTLRVVPTSMTMGMHMLGVMYMPRDWLTLMVMGMHVTKKMDHVTYMGPTGTTPRGNFTTKSSSFGDSELTSLVRVFSKEAQQFYFNLGFVLPTGSNLKTGTVLTPTGATPNLRLPYAMQNGGGTYNLKPGATYIDTSGELYWGAQYLADIPLGKNTQSYSLGNAHMISAWLGYSPAPWVSGSLRLVGNTRASIKGIDPDIVAPVQTADPSNYGGEQLDFLLGINLIGQEGVLREHRLGFELGLPLHQDLNGPQMARGWSLMIGWQKSL